MPRLIYSLLFYYICKYSVYKFVSFLVSVFFSYFYCLIYNYIISDSLFFFYKFKCCEFK